MVLRKHHQLPRISKAALNAPGSVWFGRQYVLTQTIDIFDALQKNTIIDMTDKKNSSKQIEGDKLHDISVHDGINSLTSMLQTAADLRQPSTDLSSFIA